MTPPRVSPASPSAVSSLADDDNQRITSLILHEIAGISALDAAIAAEDSPGYVVLFQDTRTEKQANVEQMATLIRMAGGVPLEAAPVRQMLQKTQARLAEYVGGTAATLRVLRVGTAKVLESYSHAVSATDGLARTVLTKARDRTTVELRTLTAHIAKLRNDEGEAASLPHPLNDYFAGHEAKVCFRCHFDRAGRRPALERTGGHPYTYICAGCHDDAVDDFRPDLLSQMDRWTEKARDARAIEHALGRPSKLLAAHTVIRLLSGLAPTPPAPAAEKQLAPFEPPPSPSSTASRGALRVECAESGEADYVRILFDPERLRQSW